MDMSWWWIAFAVVVLLALVAAVADGRGRGGRRPRGRSGGRPSGRTRPPAGPGREPTRGPERRPRAGEIWWAEVPYEDGPGAKDRPCLVLSVRGDSALVAKITSKYHEERPGVIALPAGTVGDARGRASFLETDELREVAVRGFRRRVGVVDAGVWERVRGLGAG
ncbi:type II toxin-antitoxin system PemK/MazF family toxin [Streptomyces sp. NBC_01217]|uniref:type II toxin-antitoxin system PemK/MazF family toxin n=1 Tax=Streptomyces sp. NBC_01217 TaxID=2903779 RepID=UPI002E16199D|nr:type II toxin-antitoxin system PemK/MazF family toxin [Streptomyces sp. NBC_01217]